MPGGAMQVGMTEFCHGGGAGWNGLRYARRNVRRHAGAPRWNAKFARRNVGWRHARRHVGGINRNVWYTIFRNVKVAWQRSNGKVVARKCKVCQECLVASQRSIKEEYLVCQRRCIKERMIKGLYNMFYDLFGMISRR